MPTSIVIVATLLVFVCLVAAIRMLRDWAYSSPSILHATEAPIVAAVASSDDDLDRLAKIAWLRGHRDSNMINPWELKIEVAFTQQAREASCYVRWASLQHYIGAPSAWKWSKQTELLPPQTVHEGRMFDFVIATIPAKAPENRRMEIFGDEVSGEQTHPHTICIEVTVAAASTKPQKEWTYMGLVESSQRLVPVWINKSRLDRIPR